jgi:hypothetical protein
MSGSPIIGATARKVEGRSEIRAYVIIPPLLVSSSDKDGIQFDAQLVAHFRKLCVYERNVGVAGRPPTVCAGAVARADTSDLTTAFVAA